MITLEEIKKTQEELANMIKKYEEQEKVLSTVWVPQDDEEYHFIDCDGGVHEVIWRNSESDKRSLSINNVFKTKEEAQAQVEWLKILYELRTLGGDYWNNIKEKTSNCYTFSYKPESRKIKIYNLYSYQEHSLPIYFGTKEKIKNAIETIGEDRLKKYWFRVED